MLKRTSSGSLDCAQNACEWWDEGMLLGLPCGLGCGRMFSDGVYAHGPLVKYPESPMVPSSRQPRYCVECARDSGSEPRPTKSAGMRMTKCPAALE